MSPDELVFSLTRTGVPGTRMPAWGQAFGGPLTDEQVQQIVAFIRSWEPTALEIVEASTAPDPVRGAAIFSQTCFVCHGVNGEGTERAPALNDPQRLNQLDNSWYRNTIARGRPAKGMPTWGTVLSPAEINDVVALIAVWREGGTVAPNVPLSSLITNALFALREFDTLDAVFYLNAAKAVAQGDQANELQAIITLIEENHLFDAQSLLIAFLPPEEMGKAVFDTNCAACHGADGTGGMGPNLLGNAFFQAKTDEELVQFILNGRSGTAMDGFEGILGEEEIRNVITLIREWQK
jgi:mono/diheme cytochrome c family protein